MQSQICPRCKFRLTTAKAICNTCGYALQNVRPAAPTAPIAAPRVANSAPAAAPRVQAPAQPIAPKQAPMAAPKPVQPMPSPASAAAANVRQAQTQAVQNGGSFWRTFLGLDPLPSDKAET